MFSFSMQSAARKLFKNSEKDLKGKAVPLPKRSKPLSKAYWDEENDAKLVKSIASEIISLVFSVFSPRKWWTTR